jgi:hypothetical protein
MLISGCCVWGASDCGALGFSKLKSFMYCPSILREGCAPGAGGGALKAGAAASAVAIAAGFAPPFTRGGAGGALPTAFRGTGLAGFVTFAMVISE